MLSTQVSWLIWRLINVLGNGFTVGSRFARQTLSGGDQDDPDVHSRVSLSARQETPAAKRVRELPSLHDRTLLLTLLPLGVMAILVAAVTVGVAKHVLDAYSQSRDRMALENLALAITATHADPVLTQGLVVRAAHQDAMQNIWLVSALGSVIASSDQASIGHALQPLHGSMSECPVTSTGARLIALSDGRIVLQIAAVISFGAIATLGLGILITAWAVNRLARTMATPVENAAVAAIAMAKGDFGPALDLPSSSVREGEQLREALRHTARQLKDLTAGLEHQVATRTAELGVANEHAQAARALAEEASRSKSMFLASMSHELRTPLNAIIGYAEIIAEELSEQRGVHQDLGRIGQSARHLLALINDILDFTKLEAGRMRVHREHFLVRQVVDEAVSVISPLAVANRNHLQIAVAPELGDALGDQLKIRQILINLLSNACKFTNDGEVRLAVDFEENSEGRQLVINITDTGVGMDDVLRGQLFKPFITSDSQRRHGGTGLGLAICAHYCQLMHGSITCHSTRGQGSTFIVRLPLELPKSLDGTSRKIVRAQGTTKTIAHSLTATLDAPSITSLRSA